MTLLPDTIKMGHMFWQKGFEKNRRQTLQCGDISLKINDWSVGMSKSLGIEGTIRMLIWLYYMVKITGGIELLYFRSFYIIGKKAKPSSAVAFYLHCIMNSATPDTTL